MEKVRITVSGRDFYLKTDNPDRLYNVAELLQKKIDKMNAMASSMSLTDVVILAAFDIADENYDSKTAIESAQKAAEDAKAQQAAAEGKVSVLEKQLSSASSETAALKISLSESQTELAALKSQLEKIDPDEQERLKNENIRLSDEVK